MHKPQPWFANKILALYHESLGMRSLLSDITGAMKVRLDHETLVRIGQFNDLKIEVVADLIGETAFPRSLLWVEWDVDFDIMPGWNPSPNLTAPNTQQGILVRTAQLGQVGRVDMLTGTEDRIYILPVNVLFDWRKEYVTPDQIIEALKDSILQTEIARESPITSEYLDGMLELRRRFSFDSCPYLELTEEIHKKMRATMNSAAEYLMNAEKFFVGLANVLECCQLEDWRMAHLVQH